MDHEMLSAFETKLRVLLTEAAVPLEKTERLIDWANKMFTIAYTEGQKSNAPHLE